MEKLSEVPSSAASPPAAAIERPIPVEARAALFSPGQLAFATVASPVVAGALWHFNLVQLGKRRAWLASLVGVALAVVLGALVTVTVRFLPGIWLAPFAACIAAVYGAARRSFSQSLLLTAGRQSWLLTIGITVVAALPFNAAAVWTARTVDPADIMLSERVSPNEMVLFESESLRPEAAELGRALRSLDVFTGSGEGAVNLEEPFGVLVRVGVILDDMTIDEQQEWLDDLATGLSKAMNRCVQVRSVDPAFMTHATIAQSRRCPDLPEEAAQSSPGQDTP